MDVRVVEPASYGAALHYFTGSKAHNMAEFATLYFLIYSGGDPITPAWGNHDFAAKTLHNHPDNQILPFIDKVHHEQLFSAPPLRDELLGSIEGWLDRRLRSIRACANTRCSGI